MSNEITDIVLEEQRISNVAKVPDKRPMYRETNSHPGASAKSGAGLTPVARELAPTEDSENLSISSVYVLTALGDMGFRNNKQLKTITLPLELTEIRRSFFYECTNLNSVTIPAEVQVIDDYAFYGCKNLQTVSFAPNSKLRKIGSYAFADCEMLSAISLPEHLAYIGEAAFRGCRNVVSIQIEKADVPRHFDKYTFIGNHAFQYCAKLSAFLLPLALDEVRTGLFFGCASLPEIKLPATIDLIGNYAFQDCMNLENISFASDKTRLMPLALNGLPKDMFIKLPDGREEMLESVLERMKKQKRNGVGLAIGGLLGRTANTRTA